eukprot:9267985-Ditylum_brightwellii.AAC.1
MLLNAIKAAIYKYDHRKDKDTTVVEATMRFWNLYQGKEMSNLQLYEKFKTQVNIIKENGSNIAFHLELTEPYCTDRDMTEEQEEEWKRAAKEKYLVQIFLKKLCRVRYSWLTEEIYNDQVRGQPKYPATIKDAYKLINMYTDKANQHSMAATTNGAMSFNMVGEEEKKEDNDWHEEIVPPTGGAKLRPDIRCHNCGKNGHFSSNCPNNNNTTNASFLNLGSENGRYIFLCQEIKTDDSSAGSMPTLQSHGSTASSSGGDKEGMMGDKWEHLDEDKVADHRSEGEDRNYIFTNIAHVEHKAKQKNGLNKDWLLLDNQSTVSIICNSSW